MFRTLISGSQFKILPCRGSYFQLLDYSNLSNEPDEVFARRLTTEFGVAAIPPSVFYQEKDDHRVLRFCFAKTSQTLEAAAERLCRIRLNNLADDNTHQRQPGFQGIPALTFFT